MRGLAFLLAATACATPAVSTTPAAIHDSGDERAGPEHDGSRAARDGEGPPPAQEPTPPEALRPEDAIGFARMDPSLDEESCLPPDELPMDARAWRLEDVTLVWLPCRAGAYQPTGALFLVYDDGRTERLALPYADSDGTILTDEATGEVRFDPSTGELVDLVRFRGLGDCGRRLRFRVGREGLTLLEHRERTCSDGGEGGGPETWPVRFPRASR